MKIPIKKYEDDPSLSWEERYKRLEAHHLEETSFIDFMRRENKHRQEVFDKVVAANFKLVEAIKKHRDKSGHELCWLNDRELWSVLGDAEYPHDSLPVREEFLGQCAKYYESRIKNTPYEEPKPKETIK